MGKRTLRWIILGLAAVFVVPAAACGEAEAPEETTAAPSATSPRPTQPSQPAIIIDSPVEGATVKTPLTVRGTASVFEATLIVAIKDSGGNTLCEVVGQALEGAPGRGPYEVSLPFAPPQSAEDGRVDAFWLSPKDGSVEDLISVDVTMSPEAPNIVVSSPRCSQEVSSPLLVEGTASVFEAAFVIVVKDAEGNELSRAPTQATKAAPERGTFSQEVSFEVEQTQRGTLEVFSGDPRDGSVINLFSVPVTLMP